MIPVALGIATSCWAALKKLPWKWIGAAIGAIALIVLIWRAPWAEARQKAKDDVVIGRLNQKIAGMEAASRQAATQNRAEVKAQEGAQAAHTKETDHDDQIRAAAAADAVDAYIRLHPVGRHGSCGALGLPACPDPARAGDAEAANALVHEPTVVSAEDLRICKDWVVKGQSFDAWWPGAAKIINDAADAAERAAAEAR